MLAHPNPQRLDSLGSKVERENRLERGVCRGKTEKGAGFHIRAKALGCQTCYH
jgi:hypothetical protein